MYFYSWFQSTRLVQRLMSHKNFFFCSGKVKVQPNPPPPPSPATAFTHTHIITQQEHFLIFLSYLHTKSDFFERGGVSAQINLRHRPKGNTYYLSVGTGAKRTEEAIGELCHMNMQISRFPHCYSTDPLTGRTKIPCAPLFKWLSIYRIKQCNTKVKLSCCLAGLNAECSLLSFWQKTYVESIVYPNEAS